MKCISLAIGRRGAAGGEQRVGRSLPEASFAAVPFARDAWRLAAEGENARLRHVPALFSVGNGFIGVRGPGEAAGAAPVAELYDPRVAPAMAESPWIERQVRDEPGLSARVDALRASGFVVACAMQEIGRRTVDGRIQVDFVSGYHASREEDPADELPGMLRAAGERGYDALLAEQAAWFADYWSASDVAFPGEPEAELAIAGWVKAKTGMT